jgi:hypothetical protein
VRFSLDFTWQRQKDILTYRNQKHFSNNPSLQPKQRRSIMKRILSLIVSLSVVFVAVASIASAGVPEMMHYQGHLTDEGGAPLDSTLLMTFTIYDDSTGGGIWWSETQLVQIVNGLFNVQLGAINSIPDTVMGVPVDPHRYLGIQVASDPEIYPRSRLLSVPYAFRVATVDGSTGGVISGDVAIQSDLDVDGDLRVTGKATIGPGHLNTGSNAFVAGGNNSAVSPSATVSGGSSNRADGFGSTVGGGQIDTASANYATVAGGYSNTASGPYSAVGGGENNTAGGDNATVGGGVNNSATGSATVGGGDGNTASGLYSTISGGLSDTASGEFSTVGGGHTNSTGGNGATIGGGWENRADSSGSTIGGGSNNIVSDGWATIGGGLSNTASGWNSTVGGGGENRADSGFATVSGGRLNTADGDKSTVGGGWGNTASQWSSTVGGGEDNWANAGASTISGGVSNSVNGDYGTVGGGDNNATTGWWSTVGGGAHNDAGFAAIVAGGTENQAIGNASAICGGERDTARGSHSAIGGGLLNTTDGEHTTISGGQLNYNGGDHSAIPGGREDTLTSAADYSMAFGHGVYVNHAYRVVLFDSAGSGRLGINRDDRTGGIDHPIHVGTDVSNGNGAYLTSGGAWVGGSSRSFKENFQPLNSQDLLAKISGLPVEAWQYGTVRNGQRDDKYLSPGDVAGVALAGVKELTQENRELRQIIEELNHRIAELEKAQIWRGGE